MLCCERGRGLVTQCAMRPRFVVVTSPRADDGACGVQALKPVVVQAFIAEATIEALDESVLRRFTWSDEFQLHAVVIGPLVQRPAGELRSLVSADRRRQTAKLRGL